MSGTWVRDHKGRIIKWKCHCGWRPLNILHCPNCKTSRPRPAGQEKPLDKAFKIIDEQLKKEGK